MPKVYTHNGYTVTVNKEGAIKVRDGDSISRYSMAIHHDFKHLDEYGRIRLGTNEPKPITNVGRILTGETIYHIPTWQKENKKQPPAFTRRVVAIATDKYLTPTTGFADAVNLGGYTPMYGQDLEFGSARAAPNGHDVGSSIADLAPKMRELLNVFASGDQSGMATRLFNAFLAPQSAVKYFDDASLNIAARSHSNIQFWIKAALNAPIPGYTMNSGRVRIHQALKTANWDIAKIIVPKDLGVPAFNQGSKVWSTKDFDNGLGVMINGLQHAYVVATAYTYDKAASTYDISLRYVFYDVFGLDDDDLDEFGSKQDGRFNTDAGVGITAWWQLQHQHNHAPLVTRIILDETFNGVPAT